MSFQEGAVPRLCVAVVIVACGWEMWAQSSDLYIYLDSQRTIDERVEDLLSRLTLKEKVGQLNLRRVYAGDETAQLYVHETYAPVSLPVKQLRGIERVRQNRGRQRQ
jgi:hypothetical protein